MTCLKKKHAILALLCALSAPVSSPAVASADMFGAMFRMMLVMMNAMSGAMLGNTNSSGMGTGNSFGLGMTAWPSMSGMSGMNPVTGFGGMPGTGMSPWSGMSGFPMSGGGMNPWSMQPNNSWANPFSNAYPYSNAYPSYANNPYSNRGYGGRNERYPPPLVSLLDGRWYGSVGEILEIRGDRFRLQDGQSGITGAIRIENNIVNLYSPQTGTVSQYTFIRNQSDLMLQDATGQVLSFRQQPVSGVTHTF
jgi:hypothetical protein